MVRGGLFYVCGVCRSCRDSAMAVQSSRLVLNESMCTVTPMAIAASRILSHSGCTRTILRPMVSHSVVTETALTLTGMALCSWKSLMYGPSLGCDMSQACRRGEPFIQHHAVSSRNGVVGSTGRNIPVTPSPSDKAPAMISTVFFMGGQGFAGRTPWLRRLRMK